MLTERLRVSSRCDYRQLVGWSVSRRPHVKSRSGEGRVAIGGPSPRAHLEAIRRHHDRHNAEGGTHLWEIGASTCEQKTFGWSRQGQGMAQWRVRSGRIGGHCGLELPTVPELSDRNNAGLFVFMKGRLRCFRRPHRDLFSTGAAAGIFSCIAAMELLVFYLSGAVFYWRSSDIRSDRAPCLGCLLVAFVAMQAPGHFWFAVQLRLTSGFMAALAPSRRSLWQVSGISAHAEVPTKFCARVCSGG